MTNKNTNNTGISGLTQEMIDAAVANPGVAITSSDLEQASVSSPRQSVPIKSGLKDIRPNVEGNHPGEDGLVSGVSDSFVKKLISTAQEDAAAALKELEDQAKTKESLSAEALRRDLEAMRRQIRRLEKTIKELTKQ